MYKIAGLVNLFFIKDLSSLSSDFFLGTSDFFRHLYKRGNSGVVSMGENLRIIYSYFVMKGYFE